MLTQLTSFAGIGLQCERITVEVGSTSGEGKFFIVGLADAAVQADIVLGANQGAGLIARYSASGSYYLGMVQADAAGASLTPYLFEYVAGAGFVQIAVGPAVAASSGSKAPRGAMRGNSTLRPPLAESSAFASA